MNDKTIKQYNDLCEVMQRDGQAIIEQIRSAPAWNHGPYQPCTDAAFERSVLPYEAADLIQNLLSLNQTLQQELNRQKP